MTGHLVGDRERVRLGLGVAAKLGGLTLIAHEVRGDVLDVIPHVEPAQAAPGQATQINARIRARTHTRVCACSRTHIGDFAGS